MFGTVESSEEDDTSDKEGSSRIVAYTVVEGEAEEDEEELEEEEEEKQEPKTETVLYPGLQLPPKYRSTSSSSLPEHHSSASESDGDQPEDYNSLFSDSKFSMERNSDEQDYYYTTEFQRKVCVTN